MIGYHIAEGLIADSKGNITRDCKRLSILDNFLRESRKDVNIFYHLEANAAALYKNIGLTEKEGVKLALNNKIYITPYSLRHYPNRIVGIDYGFGSGHHYANIYNARQYASTRLLPEYTDEEAIGKAKKAEQAGNDVIAAFAELGLPTFKLTSPVNVFLTDTELDIPLSVNMPEGADTMAYQCIKGNWLEAFSCGYWDNAYDYDINGAYPSEMAWLSDLRRGKWTRTKEYVSYATYGFVEGEITTWARFHPFLAKGGGNTSYTPVGKWHTFLTFQELKFLYKYNLGSFKIEDGWWWTTNQEPEYPLQKMVLDLYTKRQTTQSKMTKEIIHRILAGIWGKFSEVKKEGLGNFTNSAYAAIVEANNRLKVARACIENNIVPLHIAVDGIITDKPLNLNLSNNLGEWRMTHKGKCLIVNSGVVGFEGKGGNEEFSLTYEWLRGEIDKNPQASEYSMTKYAPVTLAKALATDYSKLGIVEELKRAVFIDADNKRVWQNRATTGGELLKTKEQSYPIEVSIVRGYGL